MSDTSTTPSAAEVRVLFAGSLANDDNRPGMATAWMTRLVKALLSADRPPTVILNGGRAGKIDEVVIRAALEHLGPGSDLPSGGRLRSFVTQTETKLASLIVHGDVDRQFPSRYHRRIRMVQLADVVVAVGGDFGTSQIVGAAQMLGKPVIPLPFAGRRSAELFAKWETEIAPTLDADVRAKPGWAVPDRHECWNDNGAEPSDVATTIRRAAQMSCFVSQSHDDADATAISKVVRETATDAGFRIEEQKNAPTVGSIYVDLHSRLQRSSITIAILQDSRYSVRRDDAAIGSVNPNVMYEVGLSAGRGTPTLVIAPGHVDVPFDIDELRAIDSSVDGWADELCATLRGFREQRRFAPRGS